MSDVTALSNMLATFAATYLLHSTVLLSTCWVFLRLTRTTSHFLVERTWKLAAVLGLITTLVQMTVGESLTFSLPADQVTTSDGTATGGQGADVRFSADLPVPIEYVAAATDDAIGVDPTGTAHVASEPIDSAVVDLDQLGDVVGYDPSPNARLETGFDSLMTKFAQDSPVAEPESGSSSLLPMDSASSNLVNMVAANPAPWALGRQLMPWVSTLTSVLLIGCVVFGGMLLAIQSLHLQTRFATSRLLKDGPARRATDRFLKRNRIRRKIRLLTSTSHHEPVTYGLFVWTIVLPQHTEERLGKEELKALLAHEIAHLVRGDVWWLWIGRLICTCLSFQPLNLLARRNWQQATEYLCDDWAVERGVRSISLARCLTQIAEWRYGRQASKVGLAAGGTRATLVQRVERLVNTERPVDAWARPWGRRLLAAGACAIAIILVGLTPRFGLSFPSNTRSATPERISSHDSEKDAAQIEDEWQQLQEELLQLDADLAHANKLLTSSPHSRDTTDLTYELNRRATAIRARRSHITSLLEKESRR